MTSDEQTLQQNTRQQRTYLHVPFAEKEQARKLGARWDKEGRAWYVPAGVSLDAFRRWLEISPITQRALYLHLDASLRDIDHLRFAQTLRPPMHIVLMNYACWKCHRKAPAFFGVAGEGELVTEVLYWPEVIEQVRQHLEQRGLMMIGTVKPRYSHGSGATAVSQGCPRCDALFGDRYLTEAALQQFWDLNQTGPDHFQLADWPPESLLAYVELHRSE